MVEDEPKYNSQEGHLVVIAGPMFAGKSEELVREITRVSFTGQPFLLVKPSIDTRYSKTDVATHNGRLKPAVLLDLENETWENLNELAEGTLSEIKWIGFDDVQFFGPKFVNLCLQLVERGKKVIVAGLDTNILGKPFGIMPDLLAYADEVRKLKAVCTKCKEREASRTYRTVGGPLIMVGGPEIYEARCKLCHRMPGEG